MGFFDIEHTNKCPKCRKEMDYLYGKHMCAKCGYTAEVEADIKDEDANPEMKEVPSRLTREEDKYRSVGGQDEEIKEERFAPFENSYQQFNYDYNNQFRGNEYNQNQKKKSGATIAVIAVLIIFVITTLISILGLMIGKTSTIIEQFAMFDEMEWDFEDDWLTEESIEYPFDKYPFEYLLEEETYAVESYSYGISELAEMIFGKNYNDVTAEEFASITCLDFYYGEDDLPALIYTIISEEYPYGEYCEVSLQPLDCYSIDFSIFPNLETLYLDNYVEVVSLSNLSKLRVLGTFMTPQEVAIYIDPSQLDLLALYDMYEAPNLEGIDRFCNLSSLYINAEGVENIDALKMLSGLQSLGLYYGDEIADFEVLKSLTAMQELEILSYALDDLSFVAYMPELNALSLGNCYYAEKSQWDYVAFAFNLNWLSINNCYIPYSVEKLMALPNLEYLDIMECRVGIDIDNFTYNENLSMLDMTGTSFLSIENGVWNDEAEEIYVEEFEELLYEFCPNLEDVYY